jgi:hypothetical protein
MCTKYISHNIPAEVAQNLPRLHEELLRLASDCEQGCTGGRCQILFADNVLVHLPHPRILDRLGVSVIIRGPTPWEWSISMDSEGMQTFILIGSIVFTRLHTTQAMEGSIFSILKALHLNP